MKDNSIVFVPGNAAQSYIEAYTEKICENLFMNDTYFGNILMCLTELNELLKENKISEEVVLSYKTDFTDLVINAKLSENEDIKRLKTNNMLSESGIRFKLIETLSDGIRIIDNDLILEFNIGALHNSIYESRLKHLKTYFNKMLVLAGES